MPIIHYARTHWKKGLYIILSLLVLVIGVSYYIGYHWRNKLRRELKSYVLQMTDSLYTLQYKDMDLDILGGDLRLTKVSLTPDTAVYHRLQAHNAAKPYVMAISAERIDLQGFKVWRYFRQKKVAASALVFTEPSIVFNVDTRFKDTIAPKNVYESISKKLKEVSIGRLEMDNTNLIYTVVRPGEKEMKMQAAKLDIRITDLLIDSVSQHDPARYLYSRNYEVNLKTYRYRSADSMYWMNVRDLHYNAAAQTLTIDSFYLEPMYNYAGFDAHLTHQKDRFEVRFNQVSLHRFDPYALINGSVVAQRVNISSGLVHVYHNRKLPPDPTSKLGKHPNQVLAKMKLPLRIDTLIAKKMDVQYKEVSPKTGETGVLDFNNVSGVLTNITNIDSLVAKDRHMIVDLHATLMQHGNLSARFNFLLNDSLGGFALQGVLKNMDGREMNQIVRPLNRVEITSLQIHSLAFDMTGNQYRATGKVDFKYDSLKIAFLQKTDDTQHAKKSGIGTFFANLLGVKKKSPDEGKKPGSATVTMERDTQKSFFNLVWKTIFKGIKETVGTELLKSLTGEPVLPAKIQQPAGDIARK